MLYFIIIYSAPVFCFLLKKFSFCLFIISDYLVSQHSGSLGGFMSLLTIIKSAGIAIYTGINKIPDYQARDYIHMYIMDLLLG